MIPRLFPESPVFQTGENTGRFEKKPDFSGFFSNFPFFVSWENTGKFGKSVHFCPAGPIYAGGRRCQDCDKQLVPLCFPLKRGSNLAIFGHAPDPKNGPKTPISGSRGKIRSRRVKIGFRGLKMAKMAIFWQKTRKIGVLTLILGFLL